LSRGFHALAQAVPQMSTVGGYVSTGIEPRLTEQWQTAHNLSAMSPWQYLKMWLGTDYTLPAAIVAYTVMCVGAYGTDQDMVQRMLTATDYKKSRRSVITAALLDLPIFAAFAFIGVLLYAYYHDDPNRPAPADVFSTYILRVMPPGIRGLVLAGVFATAMGSLSAALNALATSATNDWYIPYFSRGRSDEHYVWVARLFTALFALLMIVVAGAFAYAKVTNPNVRIIPVVLGIAGFILGPMLGVFLVGLFTRTRGSDLGNMIAITCGLAATIYFGGVLADFAGLLGIHWLKPPAVKVSFTWFALIGASVVFAIAVLFRTPARAVLSAGHQAQAAQRDDRPVALRSEARLNRHGFTVLSTAEPLSAPPREDPPARSNQIPKA
jgi:Na+/proline symporter